MIRISISVPGPEARKLGKAREWIPESPRLDSRDRRRVIDILQNAEVRPREIQLTTPQLRVLLAYLKTSGRPLQQQAPSLTRAIAELKSLFVENKDLFV